MVRSIMKWLLLLAVALPVLLLVAGQAGLLRGSAPADLGVTQGRLKAPSDSPNCVSSQTMLYPGHVQQSYAQIDPLPLKPGGAEASLTALTQALRSLDGVSIVEQKPDYIRAQAETHWLKFTDDLEFWINSDQEVIDLRSASRLGQMDFAANRKRIETLRSAYAAL